MSRNSNAVTNQSSHMTALLEYLNLKCSLVSVGRNNNLVVKWLCFAKYIIKITLG